METLTQKLDTLLNRSGSTEIKYMIRIEIRHISTKIKSMAGNRYLEVISTVMLYKRRWRKEEITWGMKVAQEGKSAGAH